MKLLCNRLQVEPLRRYIAAVPARAARPGRMDAALRFASGGRIMARLAFYTFGILRGPKGDPQVQGFFDRIENAFAAAKATPGYITRYSGRPADFGPRFFDPAVHPYAPQTLSVWRDLESVYPFAYRGLHGEALRLRKKWFVKPAWPTYAAWWIGDDEEPAWDDAAPRLEHLHDHGPTPVAFSFAAPFDAAGWPTQPSARSAGARPTQPA